MKKTIAILMVFAMLFAFASCKENSNENTDSKTEAVTGTQNETVTSQPQNDVTQAVTSPETSAAVEESSVSETTSASELSTVSADPANWSAEETVNFYKAAAIKSKAVKSKQTMTLNEMVVNEGDGILGTLVKWATPFLVSALEKNSTEFDGITGGYEKLSVADTRSVRAYKSGEYTIVEMTMKEQTDGIHGDALSGTVGHAISVVGDISTVAAELPQFSIDFENSVTKLHYSDPKFKVKINKDGIIEKGTWTYTVDVTVKNLHVAAVRLPLQATVDSAHGSVGYIITVGGGF